MRQVHNTILLYGGYMKGSPLHQARTAFSMIDGIGTSRHKDKEVAREQGYVTKSDIAKHTLVYSFASREQYINVAVDLLKFAKENFGIKDAAKLNSEIANAYLTNKIENGISKASFDKYASAITKFETAINKFQEQHNLPKVDLNTTQIRQIAAETIQKEEAKSRAYENPQKLIEKIENPTYRTIAEAQLQGGFRITELNHLSINNFKDNNVFIVLQGKGGKDREVELQNDTYKALLELASKPNTTNGKFSFNMNEYRQALKEAAERSGQEYQGTHGLRWNAAQNLYIKASAQHGEVKAMEIVSNFLGHTRASITQHYLR